MNLKQCFYLINDIAIRSMSELVVNFSNSTDMLGKQTTKRLKMCERKKKVLFVFFTSTLFGAVWKRRGK